MLVLLATVRGPVVAAAGPSPLPRVRPPRLVPTHHCLRVPPDTPVRLRFERATAAELTEFFACLMGRRFESDAPLDEIRVTLLRRAPLPLREAYAAFAKALFAAGLELIDIGDRVVVRRILV